MLNVLIKTEDEKESTSLACNILAAIKHYFPDIRLSLPKFVQLNPPTLLTFFPLLPSSTPDLPCNNFRRSYVAYCDYNDHSYKDEVVWDIERIYFVHDIHELRLEDFGHLSIKLVFKMHLKNYLRKFLLFQGSSWCSRKCSIFIIFYRHLC